MKSDKSYIVSLGDYELEFRGDNGAWTALRYNGAVLLEGDNRLAALSLAVGGTSVVKNGRAHLWNIHDLETIGPGMKLTSFERGAERLSVVLEQDGWAVEQIFILNADKDRLERSFVIKRTAGEEKLLRWAFLRMPVIADENAVVELPGYNGALHQKVSDMPFGRLPQTFDNTDSCAAAWKPGVFTVSPGAGGCGTHMMSWLFGRDMPAILLAYKGRFGAWFESKWMCCMRMAKGDSITVGTQYMCASGGRLPDLLSRMRGFWNEAGVRLEQPTPQWGKEARIYEVNIGPKSYASGRTVNPYPTADELLADLPRIQELGFNIIELMPRFPFPSYSVSDYYDIETCYAPVDKLKRLITAVHEMGMHILLDVVMHGVADKTVRPNAPYDIHPLLSEHPEFFLLTEEGDVAKTYTWSFDQANEAFRDYTVDFFSHYVRELDADGFRVDAITWNYFPNWKDDSEKPAYKSILGCYELFKRVREELWKIKPDLVLYSETTGPLMANAYDLSYCYDEVWLYENLLKPRVPGLPTGQWNKLPGVPAIDARGAAEWLDLRSRVMPENWIKVHHADSHDTHEWNRVGMYRREYFGLDESRALFAFCCFTEGGVMNYTGGEVGSEKEYARLLSLRAENPALLGGSCDYLSVSAKDRRLYTLYRTKGAQRLVPVINFSSERICTTLDLSGACLPPGDPDALPACQVIEHISGVRSVFDRAQAAEFPVELPAYGYALYEIII